MPMPIVPAIAGIEAEIGVIPVKICSIVDIRTRVASPISIGIIPRIITVSPVSDITPRNVIASPVPSMPTIHTPMTCAHDVMSASDNDNDMAFGGA
jgi:hypothetical protein